MKRHLYELKNPCTDKCNLELTNEIRETVLRNRRYYITKPKKDNDRPVSYTNITNYLNGMDTMCKLTHCLEYKQEKTTDINDFVEAQHQDTVEKLENDEFRYPHLISSDRFLMLIDEMAKTGKRCAEEMNIIYDEMLDRIKIYCDDEWTSYMIEPGMRRVVEILRTNYLNQYECYLFKKLFADKNINGYQLNNVRIHLGEYYKFLAIFDHHPYVYAEPIEYVVSNYKTDNPDEFRDFGMKEYNDVKKELPKTETAKMKKSVLDIIKRNHKVNLKKLNDDILEIINVDEEFKNKIIKTLTLK